MPEQPSNSPQAASPPPSKPLFVAAGDFGIRIVSEDGVTWKDAKLGKDGEIYRAACYASGRFVAVGTFGGKNIMATSTDGHDWKIGVKDGQHKNFIRGMGFGNGQFIAVGGDPVTVGQSSPFVMLSSDGLTWTDYVSISGRAILRRLAFGNGLFVGVGDRGRRSVSKDGRQWQDATGVRAIDTLVDIAYGNGVFVGVGLHSLRVTSEDGLTWKNKLTGEEGEHLNTVIWAGDRFVAVGMGATYFSPDGINWKREPNKDAPLTVAYSPQHKLYLGANWRGRILTSKDAITWQQVYKCEHNIEAFAVGG